MEDWGQRLIIQFLFSMVLHSESLFTDLASVRPSLAEFISLAVVTLDSVTVENDADAPTSGSSSATSRTSTRSAEIKPQNELFKS